MKASRLLMAVSTVAILLLPHPAQAQAISVDLGHGDAGTTSRLVQLTALITLLSLAPSLLVMVTAFTRIIIVLSLLRQALGLQQGLPNRLVTGVALILTILVMRPIGMQVYDEALKNENPFAMQVFAGARGNKNQLASMIGTDLMYSDNKGRPVPIPVVNSMADIFCLTRTKVEHINPIPQVRLSSF